MRISLAMPFPLYAMGATMWLGSGPDGAGSPDRDTLARAVRESRILVTFDKDFGELAWRSRLPAECGIVLFRLPMPPPVNVGAVISRVITSREDWSGHFSVVESGRIRMRPLPAKL